MYSTYNVTMRRVHAIAMEKPIDVIYSACVFVT
jgi:hypothetical protein